jgi:hypothetical protein
MMRILVQNLVHKTIYQINKTHYNNNQNINNL